MTLRLLTAAILLGASSQAAPAQGLVGGRLREARTTRPLACWRTELRNANDSVLAITYTRADGTFEFPAPAPGAYVFRFDAYGLEAVQATFESAGPSTDFERAYDAPLSLTDSTSATRPLVTEGAPRPVRGRGVPRYPAELRLQGIEGRVNAAIAMDSAGRVDAEASFLWGASHPGFEAAVLRALPEMRFTDVARPSGPPCAFVGSPFLFRLGPP